MEGLAEPSRKLLKLWTSHLRRKTIALPVPISVKKAGAPLESLRVGYSSFWRDLRVDAHAGSNDTSKSVAAILTMCPRRNTWLVCTFTLQTLSSQQIIARHSGAMPKTWAGQS